MCGIFGYNGNNPSIDKIKILGLYNKSRGTDACGLFVNQDILHGNGTEKHFDSFIENTNIPEPKKNNTIIGHTRNSSSKHTDAFTHPYEIRFKEDKRKLPVLVGAHNGTLYNWEDLAKSYNMDVTTLNDSKFLFTCLAKKKISVLEKYVGHAAFLATEPKEKNTMWVYKGASKGFYHKLDDAPNEDSLAHQIFPKGIYSLEGKEIYKEERPLFMYIEGENSIYFSSLKDSLKAIGGDDNNVFSVPANKLIKFENGKFVEFHDINRKEEHHATSTAYNTSKYNSNYQTNFSKARTNNQIGPSSFGAKKNVGGNARIETDELSVAHTNQMPSNTIYYLKGSYYLNGAVIKDGIYEVSHLTGEILEEPDEYSDKLAFVDGQLLMLVDDFHEVLEGITDKKFGRVDLSMYTMHPVPASSDSSQFFWGGTSKNTLRFITPFNRQVTLSIINGNLKKFEVDDKLQVSEVTVKESSRNIIECAISNKFKNSEFIDSMLDTQFQESEGIDEEYDNVAKLMTLINES